MKIPVALFKVQQKSTETHALNCTLIKDQGAVECKTTDHKAVCPRRFSASYRLDQEHDVFKDRKPKSTSKGKIEEVVVECLHQSISVQ